MKDIQKLRLFFNLCYKIIKRLTRLVTNLKALLIYILLGLVSTSALSNEVTTIAVSEIPNLLSENPEKQGAYNHFLNNLTNVKIVYIPPIRAGLEFEKDYIDCLFPGTMKTMGGQDKYIESAPLQLTPAYLFSKSKLSIAQLNKSYQVAIRRGFSFGNIRSEIDTNFIDLQSDVETASFLELARVDALIGYLPDVVAAYQELKLPVPYYNEQAPVYITKDAFVCLRTQKNNEFINHINDLIPKISH